MRKINIVGPVTTLTGYGIHTVELAKALSKIHPVSLTPRSLVSPELSGDEVINSLVQEDFDHDGPTIGIWFAGSIQLSMRWKKIGFTVFESDELDERACRNLNELDRVYVPSKWAKSIVGDSGRRFNLELNSKTVVVPEGVDINNFRPCNRGEWSRVENFPRPYLSNVGKWEVRKGHPELVRSIARLARDGYQFTLFALWNNIFDRNWFQSASRILSENGFVGDRGIYTNNRVNIVLLGRLSIQELSTILSLSDFGVYPYRAEGWCLPLLETMACGRPVVATYYSGPTEYLTASVGKLILPLGKVRMHDDIFFKNMDCHWAEINENQVFESIKFMLELSEETRNDLGKRCREIAEFFTWDLAAAKIYKDLSVLKWI